MTCPAGFITSKRTSFADMTEAMDLGQTLHWWDFDIKWTDNHFRASQLEPLRQMGDDLADNALAALNIKPGQDALAALREYTSRPIEDQPSDAPRKLLEHVMMVPEWVDWEQVKRGQDVYWKYIYYITLILLHFSLVGGFAAPKFVKVLDSTGYLRGSKTKERVFDTNQFLLDVFNTPESLSPGFGNMGWESIVRVRFLHAGVRARLTKISSAHSKFYNVQEHGVPINQEDNIASLFSLSSAMWTVMENRMGIVMERSERKDYLHTWRYIAHVIGVDDVLSVTSSPERADACLESVSLHISDADERCGQMCTSFFEQLGSKTWLRLILTTLRLPDPIKVHFAWAEVMLGPAFWSMSGMPNMTRGYRLLMRILQRLMSMELWVASKIMPRWALWIRRGFVRRLMVTAAAIESSRSSRTHFSLKALPKEGGAKDSDLKDMVSDESGKKDPSRVVLGRSMLQASTAAVGMALLLSYRPYR
ncbi:hypothetical protein BG004_006487 [Podila humilis]|nr:hypothetical protein BG004_006487 [Podila humilis]